MPNYADVGRAMKTLVHSYHFDDPPTFDSEPEPIILDKFAHDLSLPELGMYIYFAEAQNIADPYICRRRQSFLSSQSNVKATF